MDRKAARQAWKGKTGGGRFGQSFLFAFLKRVDVRFLYPVLYAVIPFYLLFGNRRDFQAMLRYFRRRCGYSLGKSFGKTVRNYHLFGEVVLDKFAVLAGRIRQFDVEVSGREFLDAQMDSGQGIVIVSAHVGNFELAGHCIPRGRKAVNGLVSAQESEYYQRHRAVSSEEGELRLIPMDSGMDYVFALKDALSKGEIVSVLGDRISEGGRCVRLPFMGAEADFPLGVFRMASICGASVMSLFIVKEKGTHYKGYLHALSANEASSSVQAERWAGEYVSDLETLLRKYPEQWFNYYDFWQTDKDAGNVKM